MTHLGGKFAAVAASDVSFGLGMCFGDAVLTGAAAGLVAAPRIDVVAAVDNRPLDPNRKRNGIK